MLLPFKILNVLLVLTIELLNLILTQLSACSKEQIYLLIVLFGYIKEEAEYKWEVFKNLSLLGMMFLVIGGENLAIDQHSDWLLRGFLSILNH